MLARLVLAAMASASMVTGALAWDGARAYHLRPEGTQDLSLTGTYLHNGGVVDFGGPTETTALDVFVLTPTYRRSIELFGNAGGVLIGLPLGLMSYESSAGTIDVTADFAPGDLLVGAAVGLVGMPSLAPMDYAQHKPGFQAMAAAKLFLPTGDYDPDRLINLGGNRWKLEASLPFSYVLGDTMIDPELMTFEVRPVVQIFGDNDDPLTIFGADSAGQAPIFGVEAHVTRNFGNSVWAGLDGYYEVGGETSLDGVAQDDGIESLSVGATLGLVLSPQIAMRLSYREQVYSNDPDGTSRSVELAAAYLF